MSENQSHFCVGDKIEVRDQANWYVSRVLRVDTEKHLILIHFDGWSTRYDEWLPTMSPDIRPLQTDNLSLSNTKTQPKETFNINQKVFAKWQNTFYPALVIDILSNDYYSVRYADNFVRRVHVNQLRTVCADTEQLFGNYDQCSRRTFIDSIVTCTDTQPTLVVSGKRKRPANPIVEGATGAHRTSVSPTMSCGADTNCVSESAGSVSKSAGCVSPDRTQASHRHTSDRIDLNTSCDTEITPSCSESPPVPVATVCTQFAATGADPISAPPVVCSVAVALTRLSHSVLTRLQAPTAETAAQPATAPTDPIGASSKHSASLQLCEPAVSAYSAVQSFSCTRSRARAGHGAVRSGDGKSGVTPGDRKDRPATVCRAASSGPKSDVVRQPTNTFFPDPDQHGVPDGWRRFIRRRLSIGTWRVDVCIHTDDNCRIRTRAKLCDYLRQRHLVGAVDDRVVFAVGGKPRVRSGQTLCAVTAVDTEPRPVHKVTTDCTVTSMDTSRPITAGSRIQSRDRLYLTPPITHSQWTCPEVGCESRVFRNQRMLSAHTRLFHHRRHCCAPGLEDPRLCGEGDLRAEGAVTAVSASTAVTASAAVSAVSVSADNIWRCNARITRTINMPEFAPATSSSCFMLRTVACICDDYTCSSETVQCTLCSTWQHSRCVSGSSDSCDSRNNSTHDSDTAPATRAYVCPVCRNSARRRHPAPVHSVSTSHKTPSDVGEEETSDPIDTYLSPLSERTAHITRCLQSLRASLHLYRSREFNNNSEMWSGAMQSDRVTRSYVTCTDTPGVHVRSVTGARQSLISDGCYGSVGCHGDSGRHGDGDYGCHSDDVGPHGDGRHGDYGRHGDNVGREFTLSNPAGYHASDTVCETSVAIDDCIVSAHSPVELPDAMAAHLSPGLCADEISAPSACTTATFMSSSDLSVTSSVRQLNSVVTSSPLFISTDGARDTPGVYDVTVTSQTEPVWLAQNSAVCEPSPVEAHSFGAVSEPSQVTVEDAMTLSALSRCVAEIRSVSDSHVITHSADVEMQRRLMGEISSMHVDISSALTNIEQKLDDLERMCEMDIGASDKTSLVF